MEKRDTLLIAWKPDIEQHFDTFDPDLTDDDYLPQEEVVQTKEQMLRDLPHATGDDKMALLRQLIASVPKGELASVAAALNKPLTRNKYKPRHGYIKQFRLITQHHTCRNCGTVHIKTYELAKGESKSYVKLDGTVQTIYVKDKFTPLTIQSWNTRCEMCRMRISDWSRELLEERYMQLLCRLEMGFAETEEKEEQ